MIEDGRLTYRRHGDCGPPERLRDADELGAFDVVLGEVGKRREDQNADSDEHHQQTELLQPAPRRTPRRASSQPLRACNDILHFATNRPIVAEILAEW